MKKHIVILVSLTVLSLYSCNDKKDKFTEAEEATAVELKDTVATDNTEVAVPGVITPADGDIITLSGKVTAIVNGKDGYTATLSGTDGKQYSATISIPNMDDPKDFRRVEVGEDITVTGEVVNLENDVLIKVTKLN